MTSRYSHLFAAFVLIASPLLADGDWTQFRGGPEQHGIAETTLPAELDVAWTFEIAEGVEATAAIAAGKVYAGGLDGKLYALGLADGKVLWTYEAGEDEIKSSPLVYGDTVYFGDEYGHFHAVDAANGERRWVIEAEAGVTGSPNVASTPGKEACILFGSYDAFIRCVSPKDGAVIWQDETEGYVHGTPAVSEGRTISSGCDGYLRVLDAATGEEIRKVSAGGYVAASPAVDGGRAYFGTFQNQVLAIDLKTGDRAWTYENPERPFPFYSSAAVTDRLVIVGGRDKTVHAIDKESGKAAWTHGLRGRIDASPVVVGGRVYVADQSGVVAALNLKDGSVAWQFETGDGFTASPAVGEGHLVIGTESGVLYGFAGGKQ